MSSKEQKRIKFLKAWEAICDELLEHFVKENMPEDARQWYKRMLEYNVPGGKLNRGISVTDTVEIILGRPLDDTEYHRAAVLGWCVELLQGSFLISDDMTDESITRRGQPCWYRLPEVGSIAINDAFLIESAIYYLLRAHFRQETYYVDLLDLFHDVTYKTELGQLTDLLTAPAPSASENVDISKFSLERHRHIVIYKTAFYSFYLPVALAMHMARITSPSAYSLAHNILLPLGEYFQVQDDFLDAFGAPAQLGKIGTDIVDGKCSWTINVALAAATPGQRRILDENYGKKDSVCEARVKEVYEQVGLRARYTEYEQTAYERILGLIAEIPHEETGGGEPVLKREVFSAFLDKIYQRTK